MRFKGIWSYILWNLVGIHNQALEKNKGYTTRNVKHPTGNHGFVGDTGGWE